MIDVSIVPNMQYLRTEELLLRWLELSAVADGIFRTHIGNLPNSSVQVRSHRWDRLSRVPKPPSHRPMPSTGAAHIGCGAEHVMCVCGCAACVRVCLFRVP